MADLGVIGRLVRLKIRRTSLPLVARVIRNARHLSFPVLSTSAGLGHISGTTQTGSPPIPSSAKLEVREDHAVLTLVESAPLLVETWSKEDGTFVIRNLKAGRYRVTVTADGFFPRMFLTDVVVE